MLEVGLGGRLDATNAVPADVATAGQTRRVVEQAVERFGGPEAVRAMPSFNHTPLDL